MSGATLSQERFLLECAKQERRDLEREAWAAFKGDITTWPKQMIEALAAVRTEALEEAARLCERVPGDPKHGDFFAAAIRALKEKPT